MSLIALNAPFTCSLPNANIAERRSLVTVLRTTLQFTVAPVARARKERLRSKMAKGLIFILLPNEGEKASAAVEYSKEVPSFEIGGESLAATERENG